ncbi:hypothetical protein PAXINDRAFT_87943 [Paxillus involutus ATCC 200175]|uniref:Unplaced genomic scaffold PAXINscaffold_183, whole genome shotgun sequence n=1 Tax=Paxillus involutus ATCC 200175 TaxID=664439 RepID=A0A0C9T0F8_PAXIN|nr:hypothetical protein PAXINDRAFT_87943 [Paxillus involutus ATCC 200175]
MSKTHSSHCRASILVSVGQAPTVWSERGIAVAAILFVTILHGFMPRAGVFIMNVFTIFRIVIVLFVVVAGWVVLSSKTHVADPYINFRDPFAGSSHSSNDYATATFKILNGYAGWATVNYVLNDVRNPVRTLKIAGPLGLGICAVLYLLANIAYFSAASKSMYDIKATGVTVAALFFRNVFGTAAECALAIFVALRCYAFRTLWLHRRYRARERGYSSTIRKQVLGIKLAHGKVTFAWPHSKFDHDSEHTILCIATGIFAI